MRKLLISKHRDLHEKCICAFDLKDEDPSLHMELYVKDLKGYADLDEAAYMFLECDGINRIRATWRDRNNNMDVIPNKEVASKIIPG